jgi:hypothetical protein
MHLKGENATSQSDPFLIKQLHNIQIIPFWDTSFIHYTWIAFLLGVDIRICIHKR